MSSMTSLFPAQKNPARHLSRSAFALIVAGALAIPMACAAQPTAEDSGWERARAVLKDRTSGNINAAIDRWETLRGSDNYAFEEYASFLVTYPGWPGESRFRRNAEQAINLNSYSPTQVLAYFDRFEPVTNSGRARYAVVLNSAGQFEKAREVAREAWRNGPMTKDDETRLIGLFSSDFSIADHDARMDALLWAKAANSAETQLSFVSPENRPGFAARLAMLRKRGVDHGSLPQNVRSDPGYLAAYAMQLRNSGNSITARNLLANRPMLTRYPVDAEEWYEVLLVNARAAANDRQWTLAYNIASQVDDAFPKGTDISGESLGIRDDYTSLTWLAGTTALMEQRQPAKAIAMFARYGNAARTPQTRSKGFYWAGRAAAEANDTAQAEKYFTMAAQYDDHFYGQLAVERLGRDVGPFATVDTDSIDIVARGKFDSDPLVQAAKLVTRRTGDWRVQNSFFRALSADAESEQDYLLLGQLSEQIGRRDLAVIAGRSARANGYDRLQAVAFPDMPVPSGYQNSWTFIHAVTRQESQFSQRAVSHARARGLMQLLPSTAREQAGKIGLAYNFGSLTEDPLYNIRLGSSYFERMRRYYGGSYPLAAAAYNAGPGNVNKWLRRNGDPRTGEIDIIQWIEEIPIFETKNYVQRVLENAVVYDVMYPDKAGYSGPNRLSHYLGKRTPG
ncbi:MAG: lytic transglycosylase domain-containing protein [Pseudomonadota bacterium]